MVFTYTKQIEEGQRLFYFKPYKKKLIYQANGGLID